VGGAKLTLQFFFVKLTAKSIAASRPDVQFLGFGHPPVKATIDHRINAVDSICLAESENEDSSIHLVAAGDSNGSCFVYQINEARTKRSNVMGQLLFRSLRPILSLALIRVAFTDQIFLLSGTTAGDLNIGVVRVVDDIVNNPITTKICSFTVIVRDKPHQMGTNCLSARFVLDGDRAEPILRICSGGDDQSIFCCDVSLLSTEVRTSKIIRSASFEGAASSAIRGISWCGDDQLVATGYDQSIKVWHLSSCYSLRPGAVEQVDVGDVNCLSVIGNGTSAGYTVAAGGAGIALFDLMRVSNKSSLM